MTKKVLDWGLVIATGALLLFMVYIGWATLVDGTIYRPVLEFGGQFGHTFPTDRDVYCTGDMVKLRIKIHKMRSINGKIYWRLIDTSVTTYPCVDACLPAGIHDRIVDAVKLPDHLSTGNYYLAGLVEYKINWLRTVWYAVYSEKFRVLGSEEDACK